MVIIDTTCFREGTMGSKETFFAKFWGTIEKSGIGLLEPMQTKRVMLAESKAKRVDTLLMAKTEDDINAVKEGKKGIDENGQLYNIVSTNVEPDGHSGIQAIRNFSFLRDAERFMNLFHIFHRAESEIDSDSFKGDASEEPIDSDWFLRWRNHAELISSDKMQSLWGRILAGEVHTPGSFSLRTLDLLSKLTTNEAEIIEKLGSIIIENYIYVDKEFLEKKGLDTSAFLKLDEYGIIQYRDLLQFSVGANEPVSGPVLIRCNGHGLIVSCDAPMRFDIPAYSITTIGIELLSLGQYDADIENLRNLGNVIKNKGYDVKIVSGISIDG